MASSQPISEDAGSSSNVALHADVAKIPCSESESPQAGNTSSDSESQQTGDTSSGNESQQAEDTPSDDESHESGDTSSDNESQHAEDLNSISANVQPTDEANDSDEDVAVVNVTQWIKSLDANALSAARLPASTDAQSFPFRVSTAGPPPLSTKLQKGIIRHEFEWKPNNWSTRWRMKPDIDIIRNLIKPYALFCGLPNDDIKVEFFAEGAYNKVYTVQPTNPVTEATKECIFRCAMPDFPWYHVQTEVSTMELVRHHTTIPVPQIYVFDSSMDNALGLEWMLMEKIPGQNLCDAVESEAISFESNLKIHEAIADWVDQLSRITFDKMGSIFHDWDKPLSDISSYNVGPMVFDDFTYDLRLDFPVTSGPFTNRRDFYRARLDYNLAEALDPRMKERAEYWTPRREVKQAWQDRYEIRMAHEREKNRRINNEKREREAKLKYMDGAVRTKPPIIPPHDDGRYTRLKAALCPSNEVHEDTDDRYTLESIAAMPSYCMRLQRVLPFLIDDPPFAPGSCALHHPEIHDENVLVDPASGAALALIDWEKCFTSPVRYIARWPKLIVPPDDDDPDEPEPWTSEEPEPRWHSGWVSRWEEHMEDVRLREAFDGCLEQRASPFLAPRENSDDDDSPVTQLNARIWSMAQFCCQKDDVLEGWEKMARERFMDA